MKKVLALATDREPRNEGSRISDRICKDLRPVNTSYDHGARRARKRVPTITQGGLHPDDLENIVWRLSRIVADCSNGTHATPSTAIPVRTAVRVTNVETGGKAFSMEVNQGNNKRTMQFVLDKNTVVQGHVGAGTTATVEYTQNGGQFVALNISEQSAPSQSPSQSQSPSPSQQ